MRARRPADLCPVVANTETAEATSAPAAHHHAREAAAAAAMAGGKHGPW
jgi:hypothetical protein